MYWRHGLNKGFYASTQCDTQITAHDLAAVKCDIPFSCGCSQTDSDMHNKQETAHAPTGSGFYDPTFGGGMVSLEPFDANQFKLAACEDEPQPITMTYPNEINSTEFRQKYGY